MDSFLKDNKTLLTYFFIIMIVISIFGINFLISFIGNILILLILIPLLLLLLVFIGFITASFFGSFIIRKTESLISKIPLIKILYKTIKQIIETIFKNNSNAFRDVVLLEYPRKGVWVLGFTTGEVKGVVAKKINQQLINVFVPTTPNPTSGFLLMVPKNQLKYLNTKVDDAIKTIVSAGIIDLKSKQKRN